jgi:hypothetical protein
MPELIEKPIENVFNAKFYIYSSIGGLKSERLLAQISPRIAGCEFLFLQKVLSFGIPAHAAPLFCEPRPQLNHSEEMSLHRLLECNLSRLEHT